MSPERRGCIQLNLSTFLDNMKADDVINYLFEKSIIDERTYSEIDSLNTDHKKNKFIIFKVIFVGKNRDFEAFASCLENKNMQPLAQIIKQEATEPTMQYNANDVTTIDL